MSKTFRAVMIFAVLFIAAFFLLNAIGGGGSVLGSQAPRELKISDVYQEIDNKNLAKVQWQQDQLKGKLIGSNRDFVAQVPDSQSAAASELHKRLAAAGIEYSMERPPVSQAILGGLSMFLLPVGMILLFYFFIYRMSQSGGNQAMSFGRSRAKRVGENGTKVTFEDVAGIEEAKQELYEIVDFLKNTKKYTALGAKIPKGILLTGPPGVGKTHLARAIAGEAGVPFFHLSGSDFVEMFVGVGAARVRDLFETAKAHRPSLIFLDEIDAVGRQRGAGLGGGHDEREQTLNQLLVEMDGFDPNSGVILIAATNRPDVLDPALLRPGRFDRQLVVDVPDQNGREAILKIHSRGKPIEPDADMLVLAKRTPGFTGADLANMLNEAALLAARRGHTKIAQIDLEEALDRVVAGPQRKSRVIDSKEREVIANHEAGHAIIGELLEYCDPVHKVTILPRGMSLGSTWSLPDEDKYLVKEQELLDDVAMTLGGRVAEEVVYGEVWTGSSSDLQRVTLIARAMVCEYGMSDKLGTLVLGRRNNNPFLGRDYTHDERNYSEEVARMIDEEVRRIVDTCHQRAKRILEENRDKLERVVAALLERETLGREEFLAAMGGHDMPAQPKKQIQPPLIDTDQANKVRSSERPGTELPPPRFEPGPA